MTQYKNLRYTINNDTVSADSIEIDKLADVDTVTAAPTTNQILKFNGTNWVPADTELANDTTPQLGGELASNGQNIAMADGDQIKFGTGNDMQIEHLSAENHIRSNSHTLNIVSDSPVNIKATNGNSIAEFDKNDAVYFYNGTNSNSTADIDSSGVTSYGDFIINGAGTFNGNGSNITDLDAGNVTTGTLATARGGTGLSSIGTANQVLKVNSGGTALEFGDAASGGGISFEATLQSSNFTAVADTGYFVDVSSGAVTVTLPASPSAGEKVHIIDVAENSNTNNITVGRNGNNIAGTADDMTVATNGAGFTLIYSNATYGWVLMHK